jgi:hypothetical protein
MANKTQQSIRSRYTYASPSIRRGQVLQIFLQKNREAIRGDRPLATLFALLHGSLYGYGLMANRNTEKS